MRLHLGWHLLQPLEPSWALLAGKSERNQGGFGPGKHLACPSRGTQRRQGQPSTGNRTKGAAGAGSGSRGGSQEKTQSRKTQQRVAAAPGLPGGR